MRKIKALFHKYSKWLEIIFLATVTLAVFVEIISISKSISPGELARQFGGIAIWKIILVIVVGLIGVSPMVAYDHLLNKTLHNKLKFSYLFESSWVINTINNLAGFGGFVSVGLRTEFYGKKIENKQFGATLTRLFMFIMSGLSFYSLIALIMVFTGVATDYVGNFWIWLVGGTLYIPFVWITSTLNKNVITTKFKLQVTGISILEWTGVVVTFFVAGWALGMPVPFHQVLPLLIAATIIGICSLIPGSIGSFDVIMILGLSELGVNRELALAWLLLYRIAYYFIPFAIGLILLVHSFGSTFNERYNNVPGEILMSIGHRIVSGLLYFSGVIMILYATVPDAFTYWKWLRRLNPWSANIISEFPSILLGFMLLMVARGITSKVKRALYPTLIILLFTLIYMIYHEVSYLSVAFAIILMLLVWLSRKRLFRKQFVYSWEARTIDGFIWAILVIIYVVIGVYSLPALKNIRFIRPQHLDFILFPSMSVWVSGAIAIVMVTIITFIIERFFEGHRIVPGEQMQGNEQRLDNIIATFNGNSTSQLAYLNDKRIYFYQNANQEDTVAIQFRVVNNKLIVMGDLIGNSVDFPLAIEQFIHDSDDLGYDPVFYEVSQEIAMLAHEFGFNFIKMGEEAHIELPEFTLAGKKRKAERTMCNKLEREGFKFSIIQPPFDTEFIQDIRKVSDDWLHGRKEKGFSLGFFNESYLQRQPIAIVQDVDDKIVAFTTIMDSNNNIEISIDLMRFNDAAPSGVMDYMFIKLFTYMQEQGYIDFNLGMAPLANVGTYYRSFTEERIANLVYQFGTNFYSFQGLRRFKGKYADEWRARYTSYSKTSFILYVMIALLVADNSSVESQNNHRLSVLKYNAK